MCFISCINILFYSQVFTCCIVDSATVFNSCCCSSAIYFATICSCIRFESITACNLVSQIGQVDFSFCTSYTSTCTIVIFQCYRFSCCIIFVNLISCTCCIFINSFTCTVRGCRTNMQLVSFQCFSSVMKVRYINRCIFNIRVIISCCFQFIQVCSSLTCWHCWSLIFNSRTNIVNDHHTIFCCLTSCCFRVFERSDDIASIFSCFANFMEFTIFIFR